MVGDGDAGGRRLDASAVTLDEHEAGLALKRGDVLAHGRRRVAEACGGAIDRAGLHDGSEDAETLGIDHVAIVQ